MRGHGRAGYARGSRAGPQHVPQDALDKKKPSFRLEGDSSPRQALRLPVIRSSLLLLTQTRESPPLR